VRQGSVTLAAALRVSVHAPCLSKNELLPQVLACRGPGLSPIMGSMVCRPVVDQPGELVEPYPVAEGAVLFQQPVSLPLSPGASGSLLAEPSSSSAQRPLELSNLAMGLAALRSEQPTNLAMGLAAPTSDGASDLPASAARSSTHPSISRYAGLQSAVSPLMGPRLEVPGGSNQLVPKIIVAEGEWEVHIARTLDMGAVTPSTGSSTPPHHGMMSRGLGLGARLRSPGVAHLQQPGGQRQSSGSMLPPSSRAVGSRQAPGTSPFRMQQPQDCGSSDGEASMDSDCESGPGAQLQRSALQKGAESFPLQKAPTRDSEAAWSVDTVYQDQSVDSEQTTVAPGFADSEPVISTNLLDRALHRLLDSTKTYAPMKDEKPCGMLHRSLFSEQELDSAIDVMLDSGQAALGQRHRSPCQQAEQSSIRAGFHVGDDEVALSKRLLQAYASLQAEHHDVVADIKPGVDLDVRPRNLSPCTSSKFSLGVPGPRESVLPPFTGTRLHGFSHRSANLASSLRARGVSSCGATVSSASGSQRLQLHRIGPLLEDIDEDSEGGELDLQESGKSNAADEDDEDGSIDDELSAGPVLRLPCR